MTTKTIEMFDVTIYLRTRKEGQTKRSVKKEVEDSIGNLSVFIEDVKVEVKG